MNIDLKGRKAIVTGSTAGIGRAIVEGLARAGASVVINGRGEERVSKAVQEIRQLFPESDIDGVVATWLQLKAQHLFSSKWKAPTF